MRKKTLLPLPLACAIVSLTGAQVPVFRGRDIIVANDQGTSSAIHLVQRNGTIQPIHIRAPLTSLAGVLGTRLGELVISDWRSGDIILVTPFGMASVLANVPGGLRIAEDIDGSFLVTSFQSNSIERVTRSGQVSTVLALSGGSRPYDVVVDENGDYIFCDDLGRGTTPKGVFHLDRASGVVTPIYVGGGLPLAHGLAFFASGDLAVIDGIRDQVYRLNRTSGALSVFVSQAALGNNPDSITESGDGGFLLALESAGTGLSVVHIDSAGNLQTVGSGAPFTNLEEVAVVASLTGPTDLGTGPGSTYPLVLDLPSQPNSPYAIGMSASIFPGVAVPSDPRSLFVNIDSLFMASATGSLPMIFVSWFGTTNGAGVAHPSFDLRVLGPGLLAGFTGFAQGFTVDFSAPGAIGAVTNPLRFDFR